jgi:radical SAM superfamily enzyme YgiQ (UPF0313 family)
MVKVLFVRLYNAKLRPIDFSQNIGVPFTIKYADALLAKEKGFQLKVIDCMINPLSFYQLLDIVEQVMPDAAVISAFSLEIEMAKQLAGEIKKASKIFLIGIGEGFLKEKLEDSSYDVILRGEAELEIVRIIKELYKNKAGEIKNIHLDRRYSSELLLVHNLDNLPFPGYTTEELRRYGCIYPVRTARKLLWGHILSSRGCLYECSFCSPFLRNSYGAVLRFRSAANILDEIEYLMSSGVNIIVFDDDNLTASESHLVSICEEILKRNVSIKWIAHARIDNLNSKLLKIMKDAGCVLLRLGIESGSNRVIRSIKKSNITDWAGRTEEIVEEANKAGISTVGLFLIGLPSETEKDIRVSIKFAKRLKLDILQVHFFVPYPGSALFAQFKDTIEGGGIRNMHHYARPVKSWGYMSTLQLERAYQDFYREFIFRPSFLLGHIRKFTFFYFRNRYIFMKLLKGIRYIRKG